MFYVKNISKVMFSVRRHKSHASIPNQQLDINNQKYGFNCIFFVKNIIVFSSSREQRFLQSSFYFAVM